MTWAWRGHGVGMTGRHTVLTVKDGELECSGFVRCELRLHHCKAVSVACTAEVATRRRAQAQEDTKTRQGEHRIRVVYVWELHLIKLIKF